MGLRKTAAAACLVAAASACSLPTRELRYPGGYPGYAMDRHFINSSRSKQLYLLRMTAILALAARVGNATITDGRDANAFVQYLRNATDEINYAAGHLWGEQGPDGSLMRRTCTIQEASTSGATGASCDTYIALFESDLPEVERKLARVVISALPQRQAAAFARAVGSGNMLSAAWRLLRLASASADGLHRGAGVYRSTHEVIAQVFASADPSACRNGTRTIRNIIDANACLGFDDDRLGGPAPDASPFAGDIPLPAFDALFEMTRTACGLLPLDVTIADDKSPTDVRRSDCAQLRFNPQLRFGGSRGWQEARTNGAAGTAEAQRPPASTGGAAEPAPAPSSRDE